ncbi:MAG: hypothetical protein UT63_C0003G0043 [Candidatus Gottesmanbacteria bacterium GW2011_GWC2_39_8]|uniref:Uncharacterized protein n=1 Tax=Candidatus Gottesmanbacteria bacterium GW2011_GWC2_39_8 TaxID=1618450 RepID=A0A0G0T8Y6_9BACT|nr:MAG: hypothetical protein UT63_C0003G0043 [Candidatus Gottesmanbacteria bacterium GW2011_GWC2_39_8]
MNGQIPKWLYLLSALGIMLVLYFLYTIFTFPNGFMGF